MLYVHEKNAYNFRHNRFVFFVVWGGIEPPTQGFSVLCSTDWATAPYFVVLLRFSCLLYPAIWRDLENLKLLRRFDFLRPTELPHRKRKFELRNLRPETEFRNRAANIGRSGLILKTNAALLSLDFLISNLLGSCHPELAEGCFLDLGSYLYIPYSLKNLIRIIFNCSQLKLWSASSSCATCNEDVSQPLKYSMISSWSFSSSISSMA